MKKTVFILMGSLLSMTIFMAANMNGAAMPDVNNGFFSEEREIQEPLSALKNPHILIKKKERKLFLYDRGNLIKTYEIGLGFAPVGSKRIEGDGKTPEGNFYIFTKNPKSRFYLSLGLSYPTIEDAKYGLENRLITKKEHDLIVTAINNKQMPLQKTKLGGEIYIHGGGYSKDWTWGCVALSNENIKELFDVIPTGSKVKIEP